MTFRRTSNGYSNLHLFTGTDLVVLVEGGKSYTKEEVLADQFNVTSIDSNFWQAIFQRFLPALSFNFRAVGSKQTLLDIANDVISGAVDRTLIAMDRDFDDRTGNLINAPQIFYSMGYSWENDVWRPSVISAAVQTCTPVPSTMSNYLREQIEVVCNLFEKTMRSLVRSDCILSESGHSVIPRKGPGILVEHGNPRMNRRQVALLLRSAREENYRHNPNDAVDVWRDCYGHLLSMFAHEVVEHFHKNIVGQRTQMRAIALDCIGISKFIEMLNSVEFESIKVHYEEQVARLTLTLGDQL